MFKLFQIESNWNHQPTSVAWSRPECQAAALDSSLTGVKCSCGGCHLSTIGRCKPMGVLSVNVKCQRLNFLWFFLHVFSLNFLSKKYSDISYSYDQLRTFNWDEVSSGHLWKHCHRGASRLELRGQLAASSVPETIKPSSICGWWNPSFLTLSQVIHSHPIIIQSLIQKYSKAFTKLPRPLASLLELRRRELSWVW